MKNYGQGNSIGLEQTVSENIETGFRQSDIAIEKFEVEILRTLARKVTELAHKPEMDIKRKLWFMHNKLQTLQPVVFCDPENGWNEIITDAQIKCKSKLARRWEMNLRKEIFWGEEMGDDRPVEPFFNVPYTVSSDNWGFEIVRHRTSESGSFVWDSPIQDYEKDLKKLHPLTFEIDWETTNACLEVANEVFDDILSVRLKGVWWWSMGLSYPAILLRGMENLFMDFMVFPDEVKEMMSIISKGFMNKLDYLEKNNLLSLNNNGTYVGSGGYGYTDELPQSDFNGKVRCVDMWGFTESQETVGVSSEMYEEFIFPYEKQIMDRFGLTCYGCCEPLDGRWHVVKKHHNLRRVSCSAWADLGKMAEYLGKNYIASVKPSPVIVSYPDINKDAIRKQIQGILQTMKGCVVEIIMKDNHTIGNRPENVVEWTKIAKEEVDKFIHHQL